MGKASTTALEAIALDLKHDQLERRRHYAPALAMVLVAVFGSALLVGLRHDLLTQPLPKLVAQLILWPLCLLAFPAIGVGLWFPTRSTRIGLVLAALVLTALSSIGMPDVETLTMSSHALASGLGCFIFAVGTGTLVLGVGSLSGAFVQQRRRSAIYWVAAGVALCGLNVITWHCNETDLVHILLGHWGAGACLAMLALVTAIVLRVRG